jgi:predicted ribosomally synthesized peptide with SipW-like signal peptide
MKKILLSLAIIAVVSAASVGATKAYFSDAEASNGNSFTAGSLDLVLGEQATLPFSVTNIVPGDHGTGRITLTNQGSIPGALSINLGNVLESENDLTEPELHPGYGTADYPGPGELGLFLKYTSFIDVNRDGVFNSGDIQITYNGQKSVFPGFWGGDFHTTSLSSMVPGWNSVMTLNNGQSVDLVINWLFPTESEDSNYSQNIAMTDGESFDIGFVLNQIP